MIFISAICAKVSFVLAEEAQSLSVRSHGGGWEGLGKEGQDCAVHAFTILCHGNKDAYDDEVNLALLQDLA